MPSPATSTPSTEPRALPVESAPISIAPPSLPFGRMDAIDAARLFATFGIIWTHVAEGQGQTSEAATMGRFGTSFYVIAAALFVVQSAIRMPHRGFRDELTRKAKRLLWPFVLWSMIYGAYYGYQALLSGATWKGLSFWWGPVAGTAVHLWFLPFVFVWGFIASRIVPHVLGYSTRTILVIGGAISALTYWYCYTRLFFSLDRPWLWSWHLHRLDRWIVEVPPFVTAVVGCLAYYRLSENKRAWLSQHLLPIGLLAMLGFVLTQGFYLENLEWIRKVSQSEGRFMANVGGLLMLVSFLALGRTAFVRRLAPIGRFTYLAFLSHMLVIELFRGVFAALPGYGSVSFSLLASLVVLAGSLLVSYVIRKTPALKWLRP